MLAVSPDRWRYTRRNWLNVAVIVLSFPLLPALLSLARLARLARLFRVVRLAVVTPRGVRALRLALGREGLLNVVAVTAFLILAGGGLLAVLEPQTARGGFWDGVWWGVVTATTVGYGLAVMDGRSLSSSYTAEQSVVRRGRPGWALPELQNRHGYLCQKACPN